MIEFWHFVWILIFVQMSIGVWLTFRLYPGPNDDGGAESGGEAA